MQAGKSLAAAIAVALGGVAMAAAVSDRIADGAPAAAPMHAVVSASNTGRAPAAVATAGDEAPVPFALTLHGEIAGLAAGAPATATVSIGGRSYPAEVQGNAYTAAFTALSGDEMVVVEVASTRARYRSALGSAARLAAAAGGDAEVTLAERASLRVSPFSSALAFMVNKALGGRDAGSDAEFENITRSIVGQHLATAAYMLNGWTSGAFPLPQGYTDGQQALEAPAAVYNQAIMQANSAPAMAYLYDNADNVPLTGLSQLPEAMAMLGPVPLNEASVAVSDMQVLYRQSNGVDYALFEEEPLVDHPRYSAALTAQGAVALTPVGAAGSRNALRAVPVAGGGSVQVTVQRVSRGHELRRLVVGDVYSLWMSRSLWFDSHHSATADFEQEFPAYSWWSAFDLKAVAAAHPWSQLLSDPLVSPTYVLPTPCNSNRRAAHLPAFGKCEHREHYFGRAGTGYVFAPPTVNDSMGLDLPNSARNFTPDLAGGALRITQAPVNGQPSSRITFWRYEEGDALRRPVIYLSSTGGGYMAGASMALMPEHDVSFYKPAGSWRGPLSQGRLAWNPLPTSTFEIRRLGLGVQRDVTVFDNGGEPFTPGRWYPTVVRGVSDYQYTAKFGSNPPRPVVDCDSAFATGASECAPSRVRHFRALQRVGTRLYGVVDFYSNAALKPAGYSGAYEVKYMDSRADYIECVSGECLTEVPATP